MGRQTPAHWIIGQKINNDSSGTAILTSDSPINELGKFVG